MATTARTAARPQKRRVAQRSRCAARLRTGATRPPGHPAHLRTGAERHQGHTARPRAPRGSYVSTPRSHEGERRRRRPALPQRRAARDVMHLCRNLLISNHCRDIATLPHHEHHRIGQRLLVHGHGCLGGVPLAIAMDVERGGAGKLWS
jgi:hypothetical protein